MATDFFLKLDGIKGESADSKHKDEIEIHAWRWQVDQPSSRDFGSGIGAGRAHAGDFGFASRSSKATPYLFAWCSGGKYIKEAVISCRKATKDGKQEDFLVIKLTNCMITKFTFGAATQRSVSSRDNEQGGPVITLPAPGENSTPSLHDPMDTFEMAFEKMEVEFRTQKEDLSLEAPVKQVYNFKTNVLG